MSVFSTMKASVTFGNTVDLVPATGGRANWNYLRMWRPVVQTTLGDVNKDKWQREDLAGSLPPAIIDQSTRFGFTVSANGSNLSGTAVGLAFTMQWLYSLYTNDIANY